MSSCCGCGSGSEDKKQMYKCEGCGKTSDKQANCCGKPMKKSK
ncbi:MAG: hypothetical protein Q7K21_00600 [Elusimicrobiota bacterium]|nr:hypothetical protein [Elusimicrobiota bacterium]